MKKLSIVAIIALTVISSSFANGPAAPHFKGVENFTRTFPQATVVNYQVKGRYTEVNFTWNNMTLEAFFDQDGELIGTTRNIAVEDLPLSLIMTLKSKYAGFRATEAIEFNQAESGLSYYVTVTNTEKTYLLHITPDGVIDVFKKMKN